MAPVSKAPRRYFIEVNAAMALFFLAVYLRKTMAPTLADPVLKSIVIAAPVVPILLTATAMVRFFKRIDEYRRRQFLESFAIAAAATCVFSVCWMFLTDLGLPTLTIFYTWPVLAGFWVVIAGYVKLREKMADGEGLKMLGSLFWLLVFVGVGTGLYAIIAEQIGLSTRGGMLVGVATLLFAAYVGIMIFTKKDPC